MGSCCLISMGRRHCAPAHEGKGKRAFLSAKRRGKGIKRYYSPGEKIVA